MKTICLIVLLLFGAGYACASAPDSLYRELHKAPAAQRPAVLYNLFKAFLHNEMDSAFRYADLTVREARRQKDTLYLIRGYRARGYALMQKGSVETGIADMKRGVAVAGKSSYRNVKERYYLLNDIGVAYTRIAHFGSAMEYLFRYMTEKEKNKKAPVNAIALGNIGALYANLGDPESALIYYQRGNTLQKSLDSLGEQRMSIIIQSNIAECYGMLGRYDEGLGIVQKLLADCVSGRCGDDKRANLQLVLGQLYLLKGDVNRARDELELCLELSQNINLGYERCAALRNLADVALQSHRPNKAIALLDRAQKEALRTDLRTQQMHNHRLYAEAYTALDNPAKAARHWSLYIDQYRRIFNSKHIRRIAKAQNAYEQRKNRKKIADQQKKASWQEKKLKIAYIAGAIAAVAAAVILFGLLVVRKRYLKKQQEHLKVSKEKEELEKIRDKLEKDIEKRDAQIKSLDKMVTDLNREMSELMHRISHDIQGPLASVKGACELGMTSAEDPGVAEYLGMANKTLITLDSMLTRLQHTMEINNEEVIMEQVNLLETTQQAWEQVIENRKMLYGEDPPKNMQVNYMIKKDMSIRSHAKMIKAIMASLLDNAIKFRNTSGREASFVKIYTADKKEHTEIYVIDNGIGVPEEVRKTVFDLFIRGNAKEPNTGGMGLYIASIAARRIGATIKLDNDEEGHTRLTIRAPKNFEPPKQARFKGKKITTWQAPDGLSDKEVFSVG